MYLANVNELRYKRNKHVAIKLFDFSEDLKRSKICYDNFKLFILVTEICNEIKKTIEQISKKRVSVCVCPLSMGRGNLDFNDCGPVGEGLFIK